MLANFYDQVSCTNAIVLFRLIPIRKIVLHDVIEGLLNTMICSKNKYVDD